MKPRWIALALVPALFLTACEDEAGTDSEVETGGEAAGELLGGTISDDMLPLEQLTSAPPPAIEAGDDADEGEAAASEAGDGEEGDAVEE